MVMLMLVPVSPSGTGKTFSSSIWLRWLAMLLAPLIMLSLKTEPLIILRSTSPNLSNFRQETMSSTETLIFFTCRPVASSTTYLTLWVMLLTMAEMLRP